MSAYLCEARHISAIVNATRLTAHMRDYSSLEAYLTPEAAMTVRSGLNTPAEALYSDLLQTNLDSLGARYPSAAKMSDWTEEDGEYRLDSSAKFPSVIAAIKGIQCFEYQSCEHDGWKGSQAHRFCKHLVSELIAALPGYSEAAWGFND